MATKETEVKQGIGKGKGLCVCCDCINCGKRHGPYPKKHMPYLNGQKQRVSWRPQGCPSVYNNDYVATYEKNKK